MITQKLLINAIITGILWWFTYLYIRRYFNPENKNNIEKYRLDAIYGGIASGISIIIKDLINDYIIKL